jgi:hypothetical protein
MEKKRERRRKEITNINYINALKLYKEEKIPLNIGITLGISANEAQLYSDFLSLKLTLLSIDPSTMG